MDPERLVKSFMDMVAIYSPSGDEGAMAEDVADRLTRFGLNPHVDKYYNVVAQLPGKDDLEPIILNAHIDTVEPGKGIKAVVRDGYINSSGPTILAADNKASVAAILEVTARLQQEGFRNNCPVDLIFTPREETTSDGPRLLDYNLVRAKRGYVFDTARPLGTILLAEPFYNRVDLDVSGRSAHACLPEEGANALAITVKALSNIRLGKLDEDSMRNLRVMDADVQTDNSLPPDIRISRNTIPGKMIIRGEVRSFLEAQVEAHSQAVKEAFEAAIADSSKPEMFQLRFEKVRENGGYKYSANDPSVQKTMRILRSLGYQERFVENSFGLSDTNVFAEKGVRLLNIGDGVEGAHTLEERISIDDLIGLTRIVYALVTSTK